MDLNECITIIKDVIVSFSALGTVSIAFIGLNKWKKEIKGKAHFETAKDLMRAVYKFRDHMSYTRNNYIPSYEFPKEYDLWKKDSKEEANAYSYIYTNRMKPLIKAGRDFDLYTVEAEALWGEDIKNRCKKLRGTFFTLDNSINFYIKDIANGRNILKSESKLKKEIESDI